VNVVTRTIDQPPDEVFAALTDPETYPHWLVGARDIRSVDPAWPAPGSSFHHRVGLVGPLKVADSSTVVAIEDQRLLDLEVRARPFGRGRATFRLRPGPSPSQTIVELAERPIGALRHLAPLLDRLAGPRNRRSLEQLDDLLRTGTSHRAPG
jgi:uncharacterized protein YndB with AHSA1/START domain